MAVVAAICLVFGWLFDQVPLVWAALGVSVLGVVLVVARAWRNKRATEEATAVAEPPDSESDSVDVSAASRSDTERASGDEDSEPDPSVPARSGERGAVAEEVRTESDSGRLIDRDGGSPLDADTSVYVVAGRKRFHTGGCRLVGDRGIEEVTLSEAHDEAFTPCTACISTEAGELLIRHS
jgi:hypothetical protein